MDEQSHPRVTYPHLELADWPFNVVPPRDSAVIWAGRPELKRDIEALVDGLTRRRATSLHLMWADFGAGKTHSLFYVSSLAQRKGMLPIYAEWPKKTNSFVDVYREVAKNLSFPMLEELFWAACETRGVDEVLDRARQVYPDFATLLDGVYRAQRDPLTLAWLRGEEGISRRELAQVGIRNPIKTTDNAISLLIGVCSLVVTSRKYSRILLMLDEFQRVDQLSPKIRGDVNAGIHTLFNSSPTGLSIILSFSIGRPDNIRFLLSEEVRSRADLETIQLPEMTAPQALVFVADLLRENRAGRGDRIYFPFTKASVQTILGKAGSLTPRRIMKCLDLVLRHADPEMASGAIPLISPDCASAILQHSSGELYTDV